MPDFFFFSGFVQTAIVVFCLFVYIGAYLANGGVLHSNVVDACHSRADGTMVFPIALLLHYLVKPPSPYRWSIWRRYACGGLTNCGQRYLCLWRHFLLPTLNMLDKGMDYSVAPVALASCR